MPDESTTQDHVRQDSRLPRQVITVNVSFGSATVRRANGAPRIGRLIALFRCEEYSDMVSSVNSSLAANLLGADKASPQAENKVGASDSFSQQLLSMLQSSLERLGVAAADIRPVTQGVDGPSQRQFLVTLAEERGSAAAAEPLAPEVMYEDHPGFNPRLFATEEMAGWLARRLGGEVGTFQWEWSPQVAQPPRGYTIRFGDKEINAGALAIYFEPGRFVGADQEAALALFRDGVVNDFVSLHRPELIEEFGLPA